MIKTGILTEVPLAGPFGSTAYYLELEDGEFLTIRIRSGQKPVINKKIAISLLEPMREKYWTINNADFFRVL